MTAAYTRPLAELRRSDASEFGGKSANLGDLLSAGIPVPTGFALGAGAFRAFVAETGLDGMIASTLSRAPKGDVEAANAASKAIDEAMRFAPLPEAVRGELAQSYEALDEPPVAVRSSALGEDSHDATFAGQQESFLWIRGVEQLCDAVRDCWVSLYTARAISYRAELGQPEQAMGVTVQEMVDAEVSGVMFTCNPVSGDPSMVAVNASWGLGIAVVGGETTPDDFLVSKVTGEVVRRTVSAKEIEYVPDPAGRGAVRVEVPAERREEPCLDEAGPRRARRDRQARRGPLRLAPGHRVGDRPRRLAARAPVPAGDHLEAGRAEALRVGDLARDGHLRRRAAEGRLVPLSEDDVREILRLIDESDVEELRIETDDLSLHVVRGGPVEAAAPVEEPAAAPEPPTSDLVAIPAPMIGTFYRAEAPGAEPFVNVGARVEPTTVVCLIEVMKMMNSVPAGVSGTIVKVCVENAELVEYGTPLFRVQPDS